MTRCGIRTCTLPEHRDRPLPSNVRMAHPARPYEITEGWLHADPGYDQPGPPRRSDLSWSMVVQAFVVFVAIVLFCFLASLVEVGS